MIISQSNASLLKFELRHLRYVIAAADHHSFRRAAQILAVEPSTVSRRIRDLEDSIGTALFIRGKQRLTVKGGPISGRRGGVKPGHGLRTA